MLKIAVASGKGGTGKTTVAVGLARVFSFLKKSVSLVDCDVEEPNCSLFFPTARLSFGQDVSSLVPYVEPGLCSGCRRCYEFCYYNAIVVFDRAKILEEFCHRCGGCVLVCPTKAVKEKEVRVGRIEVFSVDEKFKLVVGRLEVGQANPSYIIRRTKALSWGEIAIIDCPPGSGCGVMEAIEGADLVLAVVESTPFGIHDFKKFYEVARLMGKRVFVVWNKVDISNRELERIRAEVGAEVLASIPFMKEFHESYARGRDIVTFSSEWRESFLNLATRLLERIKREG